MARWRPPVNKNARDMPLGGAWILPATVTSARTNNVRLSPNCVGQNARLDCIKAFSETDFTEDLARFDVPTLIIHGDDDQIVPIGAAAHRTFKLVRNSSLKVYPGAPHGITDTHKEELGNDLLDFIRG